MDWHTLLRRWTRLAQARNADIERLTPLTFTAAQANSTVALTAVGTPSAISLEYTTDRQTWTAYTVGTTITLAAVGSYVMFRGNNSTFNSSDSYYNFAMTGTIEAHGNLNSLYDKTCRSLTIPNTDYFFAYLFSGCDSLVRAPVLPSTTLRTRCYANMFRNTSIEEAPDLPGGLRNYCYQRMFYGCLKLKRIKITRGTTTYSGSYMEMCRGCTSLNEVYCSLTSWPTTSNATRDWLEGVAATGTFYCNSPLDTSTRDASHIPVGWTVIQDGEVVPEPVAATGSVQFTNTGSYHDTTITINGVTKSESGGVILFEDLPAGTYSVSYTGYDVSGMPSTVTVVANQTAQETFKNQCLLEGTLIRLSDGTDKPIEDITYEDELLVWDFDNGRPATVHPLWIKKEETCATWFEDTFDNGTVLRTTGPQGHRVFNLSKGTFAYDTESVSDLVLHMLGPTRLISCERKEGRARFYNIITAYHFNLFASGVLTSCRLSNMYPFSGLRYIKPEAPRSTTSSLPPEIIAAYRLSEQPEPMDEYITRILANRVDAQAQPCAKPNCG